MAQILKELIPQYSSNVEEKLYGNLYGRCQIKKYDMTKDIINFNYLQQFLGSL